MSGSIERANAQAQAGAGIGVHVGMLEQALARGVYGFQCVAPVEHRRAEYIALRDRAARIESSPLRRTLFGWRARALRSRMAAIPTYVKWAEDVRNTVVTEGKNAALTHFLKGSTYTASQVLGLIENTGYSAIAAGNTAGNITAAGGGSPTNGWNEAPSSTCASRGTPSFGTASSGSLATSSAVSFSIIADDTIKGAFLLCRSTAGTAPSTTVGNTNGALYSAGLFSGGDRTVANGDTLNVTYTASL